MKKILVVDDDYGILQVLEIILSTRGFHVYTHANGFNLPRIVDDYQPDLILLDVRLPNGQLGTKLCKELKQLYSIPIILFSAERQVSFKDFDADDFIEKPFDMTQLLDVVNSNLNSSVRA